MGDNDKLCNLFLNNQLLASVSASNIKSAKESTAQAGIDKLQKHCYTIKVGLLKNKYSYCNYF